MPVKSPSRVITGDTPVIVGDVRVLFVRVCDPLVVVISKYVFEVSETCQILSVSFQRRTTFVSSPRSTSIPASSVAEPVAPLFNTIILSSTKTVSVFTVVVLPEIVRLPLTVRSPDTDTFPFSTY